MSEFKVGDRVKVEGRGNIGKFIWNKNEMDAMLDKEYIVESVMEIGYLDNNEAYHLEGVFHYFHEHWLKLISKGKEMKKELKKPVAHYEYMINWVEGRGDLHESPSSLEVKEAIDESWGAGDCGYCQKYSVENDGAGCDICPVPNVGGCGNGFHYKMNDSKTWAEWLTHAYKLLDVLREIEKEEEEAKRKSEVTYKVGDKFQSDLGVYILCMSGGLDSREMQLVNTKTGMRPNEPIKVESYNKVEGAIVKSLFGSNQNHTLIEEK